MKHFDKLSQGEKLQQIALDQHMTEVTHDFRQIRLDRRRHAKRQRTRHAKRLKTLKGLTPYEFIKDYWTQKPEIFKLKPIYLNLKPYIMGVTENGGAEMAENTRMLRL